MTTALKFKNRIPPQPEHPVEWRNFIDKVDNCEQLVQRDFAAGGVKPYDMRWWFMDGSVLTLDSGEFSVA